MSITAVVRVGSVEQCAALDTRAPSWIRSARNVICAAAGVAFGLAALPATAQGVYYSGIYLRGMAGAVFGTDMTFSDVNANDPNAVLGPGEELKGKSHTSPIFGGGIGFRFSPMFWADVTAAGITNLRFHDGSTSAGAFTPLQGMSGKIDAIPVMFNGYLDVARVLGVPLTYQPYLMAGVGRSRNHMGAISGTVPGFGPVSFAGDTHYSFAWGAGAGLGIPIAPNMVIDLGYEYLDLGEVRSGGTGTLTIGGTPITATAGSMKAGLRAHTVQASLRFGF